MSADPLIVFDMDGVLVEVTESYRDTIIATVKHFTGREITNLMIQEYKNSGGFNNYLGHMRTLGFIEYPQPGKVRASDWLFLEAA